MNANVAGKEAIMSLPTVQVISTEIYRIKPKTMHKVIIFDNFVFLIGRNVNDAATNNKEIARKGFTKSL